MNLSDHYEQLYAQSSEKIAADNYVIDDLLDSSTDNRFGITLLIRPSEEIKTSIQHFLNELHEAEPAQYYYPASDIHITVMSVISCYSGFKLENIVVEEYVKVTEESLAGINPFEIYFTGVTASASAVMVQGFPSGTALNQLRDNLRINFRNTRLEQSIDKRYAIATAHATVVRFREKLRNSSGLIQTLNNYRNHSFGKFTVRDIELVYNDWYQRKQFVRSLHSFHLSHTT